MENDNCHCADNSETESSADVKTTIEGIMPDSDVVLFNGEIRYGIYSLWKKDTHQHHISETPVFAGCGVRAVGTNESNTYRRTQRKNTVLRSANQYSRTQPITCRK